MSVEQFVACDDQHRIAADGITVNAKELNGEIKSEEKMLCIDPQDTYQYHPPKVTL